MKISIDKIIDNRNELMAKIISCYYALEYLPEDAMSLKVRFMDEILKLIQEDETDE